MRMEPFRPRKLPLKEVTWEPLIPLIGKANRSLAYYDGILQGVAHPGLLLSPLTTQEAVLSSRIEGTQATLGDVLRFEAGDQPQRESQKQDIQEIINYRSALQTAEKELKAKPFNLNLLKKLHAVLLDSVRGRNEARGEFRRVQNWIGSPGMPIEKAQYVPPPPTNLLDLLDNWEKYYHLDRPDPLVQLGVLHAQFEIIHPFVDGNGRLGRMLIPLFLYEKGVLSRPMFYLSEYLESHRDEYIEHLRQLGLNGAAWNAWIGFFLRAVDEQAQSNAKKAKGIIDLYEELKNIFIHLTHSQHAVPLLDLIFKKPVFPSSYLDNKPLMPSKPMIMTLLAQLKKEGVLKVLREGSGRRPQVLAMPRLINLCEGRKVF